MRVLFFNEGNLGAHIMGQSRLEDGLRMGVQRTTGVEARFASLPMAGRIAHAAANRRLGPLAHAGLDLPTLRWHLIQSLRAQRALRRELADYVPEIVHVHTQAVALTMSKTMQSLPVVLSVDTTVLDWWAMPAWRPTHRGAAATIAPSMALERRAFRQAALVLAWTAWARRAAERSAPQAHVVEHHPGIDLVRYRPAARRARERPRVLFVGGRFAEKGGEDLLAALARDLGERVDLDLVTAADVQPRSGVSVHRLGPADPRLLDLQQQADIFCLPTYGDAAPWAVLEAMACGTPVLASPVGGIADMLDDGRAGMLVPHGDPRQLAEALRRMLADGGRRESLAARARARCEQRYDAQRQFARLVDHLHGALHAARELRSRDLTS